MFSFGNRKLSLDSYKGVRDFYPDDQRLQNYIFKTMRSVVEAWGYEEYSASILEPAELYKDKTSDEIVRNETYTFEDRGGREVTLRPEMTPTVARMVAAKVQELPPPTRWYSIPNLFRYEKPQRGRLREHFQLNVDLFGVSNHYADAEIISIAHDIMMRFGAKKDDFAICVNSREVLNDIMLDIGIGKEDLQSVYRVLDKKEKVEESNFKKSVEDLVGEEKAKNLLEKLYFGEALLPTLNSKSAKSLSDLLDILRKNNISNVIFKPTLTRGFDYYTGVVFEVFDTNKENPRSLFGGGRYDNLTQNFIDDSVPAVGFGMGDVTIRDFLETHKLLPELSSTTSLFIAVVSPVDMTSVYRIAEQFRSSGINTAVDISDKKLAAQLKSLEKRNIKFVITIGEEEINTGQMVLRDTFTREEKAGTVEELITYVQEKGRG